MRARSKANTRYTKPFSQTPITAGTKASKQKRVPLLVDYRTNRRPSSVLNRVSHVRVCVCVCSPIDRFPSRQRSRTRWTTSASYQVRRYTRPTRTVVRRGYVVMSLKSSLPPVVQSSSRQVVTPSDSELSSSLLQPTRQIFVRAMVPVPLRPPVRFGSYHRCALRPCAWKICTRSPRSSRHYATCPGPWGWAVSLSFARYASRYRRPLLQVSRDSFSHNALRVTQRSLFCAMSSSLRTVLSSHK